MSRPELAVAVAGLSFTYPGRPTPVLGGLDLEVAVGERVAVLGANGSGKTTFALHLNGLLELQSGRIEIHGRPLAPDTLRGIRCEVGLVFQDPDDQLFMGTVREDVAFGPANLGVARDELEAVARHGLARVGAESLIDRAPHHLSEGEKRRVAIASVLAMQPRLLVLDEPTSGLDPAGTRELAELLPTLQDTQIIVTHDLPFALAACDRAVILAEGHVVADGPIEKIIGATELLARHRLELPFGYPPPA
ncbi:MAG TPA: ABC transporter ATP-binding protein [Acidimicrobiales bacterium]|nr:ABC transporter ATP-binding protein [Acidimicrobiales bacterium]